MHDDGEWKQDDHSTLSVVMLWGLFLACVASILGFAIYWTYWMVLYVTGEIK